MKRQRKMWKEQKFSGCLMAMKNNEKGRKIVRRLKYTQRKEKNKLKIHEK